MLTVILNTMVAFGTTMYGKNSMMDILVKAFLLKWNIILSLISLASSEGNSYKLGNYPKSSYTPEKMALWIDGKQIEEFAGIEMNIYIIKNGAVVSYLQEPNPDFQLPILPPEVERVDLTWVAEVEPFSYKFSELKSLSPEILHHPLLSIPVAGSVPRRQSVFHLSIPCTKKLTGVATLNITLHVYNSMTGQRVVGSPLKFHLRKRCVAIEARKSCFQTCRNGGKCGKSGQCECRPGYTGLKCEQAICKSACLNGGTCAKPETCVCPASHHGDHCQHAIGFCPVPCVNGGICTHFNVCQCAEGYTGIFCQKSICKRWCGVHGRCVDVNLCECHRGWRGKLCNKTVKVDNDKDNNISRRRRRRRPDGAYGPYRFETNRKDGRKARKRRDEEKLKEERRKRRNLRHLRQQREKQQTSQASE